MCKRDGYMGFPATAEAAGNVVGQRETALDDAFTLPREPSGILR